ncbi:MAG: hypothetical protein LC780_07810 [Acidobacteria bacterium]|nr:hypothetical protein [Acidobacteriota bacterium]
MNAVLYAVLALESGRARAMLAGAVDEWNAIYALGFDRVGALRGEKRRSGIVQGEGGFAILVETEVSARARGARPLARLAGFGIAGVPTDPYRFAPDRVAIGRTIRGALADAGVGPADVGLWLPSRNGVEEMDRAESDVMREIFGEPPRSLLVKLAIGEAASSGGGQLVAATRAIADPDGPFPSDGRPRRALVNSFGAGGNFLAAVVESVPEAAA